MAQCFTLDLQILKKILWVIDFFFLNIRLLLFYNFYGLRLVGLEIFFSILRKSNMAIGGALY